LIRKHKGKRQLGRAKHRCDIKIDVTGRVRMVWTGLMWIRIGTSGRLM
jgi:hypothetical protein